MLHNLMNLVLQVICLLFYFIFHKRRGLKICLMKFLVSDFGMSCSAKDHINPIASPFQGN